MQKGRKCGHAGRHQAENQEGKISENKENRSKCGISDFQMEEDYGFFSNLTIAAE